MFILSLILIILSSYLVLSSVKSSTKKGGAVDFIYFLLIVFSQIVLSFELLSLFNSISKNNFLICNIIFFVISTLLFFRKRHKCEIIAKQNIIKVIKQDKTLVFLSICFVFFLMFQLIRIFLFPVTFADAIDYYLTRVTMWIQNGSIAHFITPDTRELIMPVNMDLLYMWVLLFRKSEWGIGIFSFIAYLGAVYTIYNLLKEINFSIKRRLWAIFVFSSFALVVIEMIVPCNDLFIGALILSSIYLFIKYIKYDDKTALYFSSLAYALAVGTKVVAITMIPVVFLIFCSLTFLYKKNYKYIVNFCIFFTINFIIFSSYNYVLNYIQFKNPFSSTEQMLIHGFKDGYQGYIANVIKYFFTIFDMSGMPFININEAVEKLQERALSLFGLTNKTGASSNFPWVFDYGNKMDMMSSFLGAMGLLVFLPSAIYAIKRGIKNQKSKSAIIMMILALSVILNILVFSRTMAFTGWNMRYILTFIVIASPVIAYSYKTNKFYKYCLCVIMFIYMIGYTHQKPVSYFLSLDKAKEVMNNYIDEEKISIYKYFINKPPKNIAVIIDPRNFQIFYTYKLRLYGFKIYNILLENIENCNLYDYDYIIVSKSRVLSTDVINKKEIKSRVSKCIYKDGEQNDIVIGMEPAMVECEVPLEYIKEKGFREIELFGKYGYRILERS